MNKIKKDKHGLYVLAGGYCFRPIFDNGYQHLLKQTFLFSENDSVIAKHIGGTSLCKLKKDDHNETWYSHGAYIDKGKKIHSENLFNSNYIQCKARAGMSIIENEKHLNSILNK